MRTRLLLLSLFVSFASAFAQSAWLNPTHEIKLPISQLNQPDRHEILKRLQVVASQLRAEAIKQPNGMTFFVQAYGSNLCGAVGNCSFWVFDSYHRILLRSIAQTAGYLPTEDHGRNDILTAEHMSAWQQEITHWKFDGQKYKRFACADIESENLEGHRYMHPKVTKVPCP
jgi:hypothetical protein